MVIEEKGVAKASAELQDFLSKLDVDIVGVASLDEWKDAKLEETALKLLPTARSVVVCSMEIYPEILALISPGRTTGAASTNDLLDRNADYIGGRLTKAAYDVARVSHKNGLKALPLPAAGCPSDPRFLAAVFSYKHAAQAAGLGYIGRSSLVITPDFGPRVRFSCCLTEAVLETKKTTVVDVCPDCDICISNCPSSALSSPQDDEPYAINKFACNAFRGSGGGCSECMKLCPAG